MYYCHCFCRYLLGCRRADDTVKNPKRGPGHTTGVRGTSTGRGAVDGGGTLSADDDFFDGNGLLYYCQKKKGPKDTCHAGNR